MKNENGFTIIECILAIAILATSIGSIVLLQSSVVTSMQLATDKIRAVWAMQNATQQMFYVLDNLGVSKIDEKSLFLWQGDPRFSILISRTNLTQIKPSQFLSSALGIFNGTSSSGNSQENISSSYGTLFGWIDSSVGQASQYPFTRISIDVSWTLSKMISIPKHMTHGFLMIDDTMLNGVKIPQWLQNMNNNNSNGTPSNGSSQTNAASFSS